MENVENSTLSERRNRESLSVDASVVLRRSTNNKTPGGGRQVLKLSL